MLFLFANVKFYCNKSNSVKQLYIVLEDCGILLSLDPLFSKKNVSQKKH